jgi:hypothetical protein
MSQTDISRSRKITKYKSEKIIKSSGRRNSGIERDEEGLAIFH